MLRCLLGNWTGCQSSNLPFPTLLLVLNVELSSLSFGCTLSERRNLFSVEKPTVCWSSLGVTAHFFYWKYIFIMEEDQFLIRGITATRHHQHIGPTSESAAPDDGVKWRSSKGAAWFVTLSNQKSLRLKFVEDSVIVARRDPSRARETTVRERQWGICV